MEPKQSHEKERSNRDDGSKAATGPLRPRRSGQGSASALANLRSMERDRDRTVPAEDGPPRRK
jgi:hypothetical protein